LSDYFSELVYLDVSGLPGSIQPLITGASGSQSLPNLRLLKVARRELSDASAALLLKAFKDRLWSLDLSDNNLTDSILEQLWMYCLNSAPLRSASRFQAEGRLVSHHDHGNSTYGPFQFIQESEWSASSSHPERYFADAPAYCPDLARSRHQEHLVSRSDGRSPVKQDTVESMTNVLAASAHDLLSARIAQLQPDVMTAPAGVTHLHLAGNQLTTSATEKMVRISAGQWEYLDCGSPAFSLPKHAWPSSGWP
jgi:hypothetical protein